MISALETFAPKPAPVIPGRREAASPEPRAASIGQLAGTPVGSSGIVGVYGFRALLRSPGMTVVPSKRPPSLRGGEGEEATQGPRATPLGLLRFARNDGVRAMSATVVMLRSAAQAARLEARITALRASRRRVPRLLSKTSEGGWRFASEAP